MILCVVAGILTHTPNTTNDDSCTYLPRLYTPSYFAQSHVLISLPKDTTLTMPRTALFVIDIQHALALSTNTSIPHTSRILNAGLSILAKARVAIDTARSQGLNPDFEIVIVQHEETPDKGKLQRGSKEWELVFPPRANDESERLVSKNVRT